jgi:hypothetical protein
VIQIVKADGNVEPFDDAKLESSLRKAGAGASAASRISATIRKSIAPGVGTQEIYKRAFALLRSEERATAARYSLRRALFEFGPTGHPFEDFVAELFRADGWAVEWRKVVPGKCVSHEVDVYAKKEGQHLAAELKYHNDPNYKTDVKVALYVKARFDDIWQCDPALGATCPVDVGFLITNTKFTETAIQFAKCSNIGLIGWSYPAEGNLYDRIIAAGIYPVTALTQLRKAEKRLLIDQGIVTVEQLSSKRDALRVLRIPPERIGNIAAEIEALRSPLSKERSVA